MSNVKYPVLNGKMVERGVTKTKIARAIDAAPRTLHNKMTGATSFTWEEVNIIQEKFFPDIQLCELFAKEPPVTTPA